MLHLLKLDQETWLCRTHLDAFLVDFWPYWTNLDIIEPFCLLGPVYFDPSFWTCLFGPVYLELSLLTLIFWPFIFGSFFWPVYLDPSIRTCLFGPIYLCPYLCQEGLPCCQEGLPCVRKVYHGVRKHTPSLGKGFDPPKSTKKLKSRNFICHLDRRFWKF